METVSEVQSFIELSDAVRMETANEATEVIDRPTALGWFRVLRVHYQWPLFEAIRYALWLSR